MYINIMHQQKIHPKIPSSTLFFKYIFKLWNFVTGIIWSQIYSIHSNSSMFFMIVKNQKKWFQCRTMFFKILRIGQKTPSNLLILWRCLKRLEIKNFIPKKFKKLKPNIHWYVEIEILKSKIFKKNQITK